MSNSPGLPGILERPFASPSGTAFLRIRLAEKEKEKEKGGKGEGPFSVPEKDPRVFFRSGKGPADRFR